MSIWLPSPELTITAELVSAIEAFQDLRYIGELRQRWHEIKKLQINANNTSAI